MGIYSFGRPKKRTTMAAQPKSQPTTENASTPIPESFYMPTDYGKYNFYLLIVLLLAVLGMGVLCWMRGGVPVKVR